MNKILVALILLGSPAAHSQTPHAPPLYKDGMIVRTIIAPERDDGYRLISLGLYSYRADDGSIVAKIGIQDVTDPSDVYGKNFPICGNPENQLFRLKNGGRLYSLTVTGCGYSIMFGRPGNEDQIRTSRDKLYAIRAQNAVDHGSHVQVGGTDMVVIFQGGNDSPGLVFFPADMQAAIDRNDIVAMRPVLFAQTMEVNSSGEWVQKQGPLALGSFEGRSYELVRDTWQDKWRVHEVGMP